MAYLIEYTAACTCVLHAHVVCATAHNVSVFLSGRDVLDYVVYAGELPYRFFTDDIRLIEALLEDCALPRIRPYLPCTFWAGSTPLVTIGECQIQKDGSITMFREISYMQYMREIFQDNS